MMMSLTSEPAASSRRQARPLWSTNLSPRAAQRLCDVATIATAAAFAVPVGELIAPSRRPPYIAFARQSAMYLAHVSFGLSYAEVGRAFGRHRTTAAYACQLI